MSLCPVALDVDGSLSFGTPRFSRHFLSLAFLRRFSRSCFCRFRSFPLNVPYCSPHLVRSQCTVCCVTFTPGAAMTTSLPRDENHASLSFESVALTAMTPGYAAG